MFMDASNDRIELADIESVEGLNSEIIERAL